MSRRDVEPRVVTFGPSLCGYCGCAPCRRPVWDRLRRIADKRVLTNAMSPEARAEMELVLEYAEEER